VLALVGFLLLPTFLELCTDALRSLEYLFELVMVRRRLTPNQARFPFSGEKAQAHIIGRVQRSYTVGSPTGEA
jgi:hypothetical protein